MMLLKAKQQHHSKREKGRDCCRWSSSLLFVSRGASTGTHFIRQIVRVFVVDLNSLSLVHLWVQEICSSCQNEQDHATPLDVDFPSFRSRRAPLCNNISGEKVRKKNHFPLPISPSFASSCPFIENLFTNWGRRVKSVGSLFLCLHSSFNAFHLRLLLLFPARFFFMFVYFLCYLSVDYEEWAEDW